MTETQEKKYRQLVAADVLKKDNPLHKSFLQFVGDKTPTKRQARKFLQKYPKYREATVEIK